MPHPAICACAVNVVNAETPRTLAALQKAGPVTYLDGDLTTLALAGTQLDAALVSTSNGAALLSHQGGFAPYQDVGQPFRVSQARVTLRIRPEADVDLLRTVGVAGPYSALAVVDRSGDVSLRIETQDATDTQIVRALERGRARRRPADARVQRPGVLPPGVVSLGAVRAARDRWSDRDAGSHLNDLCQDRGRTRGMALKHVGAADVWQVQRQVLLSFLTYLGNKRICHTRIVPGAGFVQADVYQTGSVRLFDQILVVAGCGRHFAIDIASVATCWVARVGRVLQLELYGADERAIAVFSADPNSRLGQWNDLLAALPRPNAIAG